MKKNLFFLILFIILILLTACSKTNGKPTANNKEITVLKEKKDSKTENKKEENAEKIIEKIEKDNSISDEEKAKQIVLSYVEAAKKLDFNEIKKYITDSEAFPMLDLYKKEYAQYLISDARIEELCKARLGTYKITPVSAVKNGNSITVSAKIMMVNMESLQNKWFEEIDNKYPQYLSDDEMTPDVADKLIQVLIDVLKDAEPTVEVNKSFIVNNNNGNFVINAKNEDFFPSEN